MTGITDYLLLFSNWYDAGSPAQSGQRSERYGTVERGIIYYCYCLHTQSNVQVPIRVLLIINNKSKTAIIRLLSTKTNAFNLMPPKAFQGNVINKALHVRGSISLTCTMRCSNVYSTL